MSLNLRAPGFKTPAFEQFTRHLPLRTADRAATGQTSPMWQKAADHPADDSFWQSISVRDQIRKVRVPSMSFGGWYDNFAQSDLEAYTALSVTPGFHRVVIGPWPHNMSMMFADADFGPHSSAAVRTMQLDWMDFWLKGRTTALPVAPPVRIFVMGANEWRDEREWPLARAKPTPFYLGAKKSANGLGGDGELSRNAPKKEEPDRFVFDPRNPAPTRGGAVCCNPSVFPWGPLDQRPVEQRADVLVYSSSVLKKDTEVTGPIRVVLYVATSAPDTDFTAKLVDVFPDGVARNLTDGMLRARYRKSLSKPELLKPGEVTSFKIDAGVTSNVFLKGHQIRIEVSSSNFPRFDVNPNTGEPLNNNRRSQAVENTIYLDTKHPSRIILPVIIATLFSIRRSSAAKAR